jgi:hypothetical protein
MIWISWLYDGGEWLRVAEADSMERASTALGIAARKRGVTDNRCFALTGGAPPTWVPQTTRTPLVDGGAKNVNVNVSFPEEETYV